MDTEDNFLEPADDIFMEKVKPKRLRLKEMHKEFDELETDYDTLQKEFDAQME